MLVKKEAITLYLVGQAEILLKVKSIAILQ